MRIKVGVIFGGESVEHEVSIITAVQAMNKINIKSYQYILQKMVSGIQEICFLMLKVIKI